MDNLVKMGRFAYGHPFADTETQGRFFPSKYMGCMCKFSAESCPERCCFQKQKRCPFRKIDFCDLRLGDEIFQVNVKEADARKVYARQYMYM